MIKKLYALYDALNDESLTFYDILGVTPDADENQIKRAYRKLSMVCHPDHYYSETEELQDLAGACFHELNIIYDALSDNVKRVYYNMTGTVLQEKDYQNAKNLKKNMETVNSVFDSLKTVEQRPSYAIVETVPFKTVFHGGVHKFKYGNRTLGIHIPRGMANGTVFVLKDIIDTETLAALEEESYTAPDIEIKGNLSVIAVQGKTKEVTLDGANIIAKLNDTQIRYNDKEVISEVKVLGKWIDLAPYRVSQNKAKTKYKVSNLGLPGGDLIIELKA